MYFPKLIFAIILILISSVIYPKATSQDFLTINSIGLHERIKVGFSLSNLDDGVLLDRQSVQTNNWVIYGHRFLNRYPTRKYLRDLDKVGVGDEVILKYKGKNYIFKVLQKLVVSPSDLWVISENMDNILTIITCTPIINPVNRLVVILKLVATD